MKNAIILASAFLIITSTSCVKKNFCEYECKWVHYTNGTQTYWSSTNGKTTYEETCESTIVESQRNSYSSLTNNSYTHQKECSLK